MIGSFLAQSTDAGASLMAQKLSYLTPEIALFVTTCLAMVIGLSPKRAVRDFLPFLSVIGLTVAGLLAYTGPTMPDSPLGGLMPFAKTLIAAVGIPLALLMSGTVDRDYENAVARGVPFDAIRSNRGEFYAFLLFSLTGLMLCASADDLIWLFLALELTSLPTYVMVSISTGRARSQEAGIKYFFLGAFGAAIFLFGFALIYGATGTTLLFGPAGEHTVTTAFATGGLGTIGLLGVILAFIGVCFKIAAVPMHFYTPDVYEGASTSVSAFLAFVPKTAGFIAIMLIMSAVGWTHGPTGDALPEAVRLTLWIVAVLTMTFGNVLALLQKNIKRVLAYSSVAHSGYMLVGVIAGPGDGASIASNGLGAVLFYTLCYGFMNMGAFAVLACLERGSGDEVETFEDVRGLCAEKPVLGWVMVLCSASLLGLPPLLGFWGKLYLFTAGISAGEYALVAVLGLNSAIAAFYYLKLIAGPLLEPAGEGVKGLRETGYVGRTIAATLSAASVVALVPFVNTLAGAANDAATPAEQVDSPDTDAAIAVPRSDDEA
ncbi:MAG: NADH-quinone oxidoreductase subunit N [Phycisphaerales bacterium]